MKNIFFKKVQDNQIDLIVQEINQKNQMWEDQIFYTISF